MANGITNAQLTDLIATTTQNLPDLQFEVALANQNYNVMNKWFSGDKVQIESGTEIKRNIILDPSGNAKHVRLYEKTAIGVPDLHASITAPWVQVQASWSIERREALRNRKPSRFVPLLQSRRVSAAVDLANLLEERAWVAPETATDDLNPFGLPYWITKPADLTADNAGSFNGFTVRFNGGTTSTTKGGIDGNLAANANWRNWTATFGGSTSDGVIPASVTSMDIPQTFTQRLRRAFHATKFQSPNNAKDLESGPMSNFRMYTGLQNIVEFEELATRANENLGSNLDPFRGITTFKGVPIFYESNLDSDTDLPFYGVNHAKFFPIVQEGDWMREEDPMSDVEQHNVITTYLDGSYQFFCTNVRAGGFVLFQRA